MQNHIPSGKTSWKIENQLTVSDTRNHFSINCGAQRDQTEKDIPKPCGHAFPYPQISLQPSSLSLKTQKKYSFYSWPAPLTTNFSSTIIIVICKYISVYLHDIISLWYAFLLPLTRSWFCRSFRFVCSAETSASFCNFFPRRLRVESSSVSLLVLLCLSYMYLSKALSSVAVKVHMSIS